MISQPKNRSEDISGLVKALAAAQGEIKDIARNRTVTVATRQGGEYSFKYATLSAIIDGIKEPLSKHGLAYTQTIEFDRDTQFYVLTTTLHWENQWISSVTPIIINGGSNQEFGSALSYMKRYSLAAIVGVAPDEDDDGNLADGNTVQAMQEGKNSPHPPAPNPLTPPKPVAGPEVTFNPAKIYAKDVDGKTDWMGWGKDFVAEARRAPSNKDLDLLLAENRDLLIVMQEEAPKLYKNLMTAIQNLNPGADNATKQ